MIRCRLTGQVASDPVVAPCGHVFDRAAVKAAAPQVCPACGAALREEELRDITVEPAEGAPAVARAPSFGALLERVYGEYEGLLREKHELRVKISMAEKELAAATYENEAAKRVIARLLRERETGNGTQNR